MEEGRWITLKSGRKVFIKEGQSLVDALVRNETNTQISTENNNEQLTQDILDTVNHGQVFEFSPGPTMTLCTRYENGGYTYYHSSQDEPMWRFEEAIVPELKDQFVVVDNQIGKKPRSSRFKKYGYEVIGEVQEKKRDISLGEYVNENFFDDPSKGSKWILMRKKQTTPKVYKGGDGSYMMDLPDGETTDYGTNWIQGNTRKQVLEEYNLMKQRRK